jgi:flagellum-specific peptidoglycan hydrolase FlgJ
MNDRDRYFPPAIRLAAQHSQRAHGVPACVTLAQWALESAYGRYLSGKNNPFGIKARPGEPATMCRTWEVVNGRNITVMAPFKDFSNLEAAFDAHGRLLMRPDGYYTRAHAFASSGKWEAFIRAMAPTYATDPAYATKLIQMVRRWSLDGFNLKETLTP